VDAISDADLELDERGICMARKMNIPKEKQIQGIKKALRNRKTPRAFIPSLKKRLAKLGGSLVFLFAFAGFAARPAMAQTPVTVVPQQQAIAPAGTACTGSQQEFLVNNRNQSIHFLSIVPVGTGSMSVQIDGIDASGNFVRISDLALVTPVLGLGSNSFNLLGYGYYPQIIVLVTCQGAVGTFTLNYSASSSTSAAVVGSYQTAQLVKEVFNGESIAGVGGATSPKIQTPFGNSLGLISAQTTGGSGSVFLVVNCISPLFSTTVTQSFSYSLLVNAAVQEFPVPASTCPNMTIGVSQSVGSTVAVEYLFEGTGSQIGSAPGNYYVHIATSNTTATAIKAGSGTLFQLNINTPAVGTISLFDLGTAACTGTPATNIVAVINVTATSQIESLNFGNLFQNGICLKTSAGMDLTATYQ
jgi:hypothetical protein